MIIDNLFFELLRVAVGVDDKLSSTPTQTDWQILFEISQKQSLVGVCFDGLHCLGADSDDGFTKIGMSEDLFFSWMGMAAQINLRNEILNQQCVALQKQLLLDGYRSSILKGQGVATLYGEELQSFRQSGDIDVLMWKEGLSFRDNKREVIDYALCIDPSARGSEHHIAVHLYEDTEVEMHYAPAYFCNPFTNRRFRKWYESKRDDVVKVKGFDFYMPSTEFNIVFLLAHAYRHYMGEGIGFRQMMDYYFVLKSWDGDSKKMRGSLSSLGLLKFAGAVMWVLNTVFGLDLEFMICEPNERLGRKLLCHIMQGGNFGHHNTENVASKNTHIGRFINQVIQDLSLSVYYPSEALWAPLSMIREFIRIRI